MYSKTPCNVLLSCFTCLFSKAYSIQQESWSRSLKWAFKHDFIIMELDWNWCEKLRCLGHLWWLVSIFTHAQPGRMTMTPVAMFCLLCLYHGHGAISPNREKETATNQTAKPTNICYGFACLLLVCLPCGFILQQGLRLQNNRNYCSGQ